MVELQACNLHLWTQTVRILICRGSRAYMVPEKSNAQQSVPQCADLNVHTNLSANRNVQSAAWVCVASISR